MNNYEPISPLSDFPSHESSALSVSKKDHHNDKKAKKKVGKEKAKRKKAESKCAELKYKRKADKKLAAERQRSYELACELKFHRQLIHLLYPDLDRKLGECSGGENQNES